MSELQHNLAQPKFLVDEMLFRLGRWLRAAGYDTVIATDAKPDYYLLRQAIDEDRLLVTCDRELSEHRSAKDRVIFLNSDNLEANARELCDKVAINWQQAPFTRCLVCNTVLVDADEEQLNQVPPQTREHLEMACYCPECRQVFWEGSHVKRMQHHLHDWQEKFSSKVNN